MSTEKPPEQGSHNSDERTTRIAFYLILFFLTVICIMSLFAFTYTGSIDPLDLLRNKNFKFAYAGAPDYAYVYSDNLNIGINGINGSSSTILIAGEANLTLNSDSGIQLTTDGNSTEMISGNNVAVRTAPGQNVKVAINMVGEDDYIYAMNFVFRNLIHNSSPIQNRSDNVLKFKKKGDNQYVLINSSFSAGPKQFTINNNTKCNFTINIQSNYMNVSGMDGSHVREIQYNGQLRINTDNDLNLKIPVSAISGAGCYKASFEKSPGTLDITHNQYACTPADDINVIPVIPQDSNATSPTSNKAYVSLLNGQIMGYGYASSLQFRDRDFGYPLTVVIKEGHFALLTGLLSSFLTIVIGRLVLQFKKNSR